MNPFIHLGTLFSKWQEINGFSAIPVYVKRNENDTKKFKKEVNGKINSSVHSTFHFIVWRTLCCNFIKASTYKSTVNVAVELH